MLKNPSCIDLIFINNAMACQNTTTVFTGSSDFHKLVSLKGNLKKLIIETIKILMLLDLMMSFGKRENYVLH